MSAKCLLANRKILLEDVAGLVRLLQERALRATGCRVEPVARKARSYMASVT